MAFELDALLEMGRCRVHRDVIEMAAVVLNEQVFRIGVDVRVHAVGVLVERERELELAVEALEGLNAIRFYEEVQDRQQR